MSKPDKNIELRSEEVQEILSHMPNVLIRWGITVFFGVIITVLATTWIIKYPDMVEARVMLVTESPPIHLIANANGKIDLNVSDNQQVAKGMLLGTIENPAQPEDIVRIATLIQNLKGNIYKQISDPENIVLEESLHLGELQPGYMAFHSIVEEAKRFYNLSMYEAQRNELLKRVRYYKDLNAGLEQQLNLLNEELKIVKAIYEDDSLLFSEGAASKREMFRSKSPYLQNKRTINSVESSIIQNDIFIAQLSAQAAELELKHKEERDRLRTEIMSAYEKLESQVSAWQQNYLLTSPINGTVSFSKFWSDNQFVKAGEEVLSVIPNSNNIIGKIELPVVGAGKVKTGQKVRMKFDIYPDAEYGMIIGQVESMSLVPINNAYSIEISLPEGMISTYNKELNFRQEMQGKAEIITEDRRLISRIFDQFRKLLNWV